MGQSEVNFLLKIDVSNIEEHFLIAIFEPFIVS